METANVGKVFIIGLSIEGEGCSLPKCSKVVEEKYKKSLNSRGQVVEGLGKGSYDTWFDSGGTSNSWQKC